MRKSIPIIVIAFVITAFGIYAVVQLQNNQITNTKKTFTAINACDVLTRAIADKAMGVATIQTKSQAEPSAGSGIKVSTCVYTALLDAEATPAKVGFANLVVRSAVSSSGADNNARSFESEKTSGAQTIATIGDQAFYDTGTHELNILKNDNWYTLLAYKNSIDTATPDSLKQLASHLQLR